MTFQDAMETLARERTESLVASLRRRFPKAPEAVVEEAVQDTLAEALTPGRQAWFVEGHAEGEEELFRRVYTASWRQVRGALRKVSHQRTSRLPTGFDTAGDDSDASAQAEAAELASWMGHRVDDAAEAFGRARQQTLRRALESFVARGHAVKPLAERYGLPRRYLAEASVWLRRKLTARAEGDDEPS